MLRYSHITLLLAVLIVIIGSLVSLNVRFTSTWAEDAHVHDEQAHSHDEQTGPAHSQENTVTLTDKAKINIGLKTDEADIRAIERVASVHGNVMAHPERQAIVTPRTGGIVKRIHFSVGETPKKGDVLLELESVDLQMAQIELLAAASQQKSLVSKLSRLTEVFAKQIRRELQTRQIDYLQSLSELQQLQMTVKKRKALARTQITSALEQMRFRLVKADVELQLLDNTLKRIKTLAEKRISAQKELIAKQAEYKQAKNELADAKRQFQIFGISEQTLEKILRDSGETPILSLLDTDRLDSRDEVTSPVLERYAVLSEGATELVDAEVAYELAAIKVAANRQRALAAGLTETLLETLAETGSITSFDDLPTDALIENYLAFVESSEALEGVLQLEETLRNANITLNKVRQKLQVSGLTGEDIEKIIQTGQPSAMFYVKAPASGQITEQHVTVGTTVEKSDILFSILDTDIVWAQGEVHEDTLALIQDKWQIGSEVRIHVAAYPETIYTGKISGISDVVEPEEQTVHFWAEIENPDHQLKPGMFADQTIVLDKGVDVLSIPLEAVIEDGGSRFVFVAYGATYTRHEIVVGAKDDRYIEVKDGVLPGERVVVQGTHQLMRAMAVPTQVVDANHGHPH
ncbi:efflux RND transporter periplasmic adaptor subunit [Candidatus Poribacteria bacterium]|nr:efflux RND transporter periplasmic adaptor subunit [Candidatus Poribacteria bacterium]MYH80686.1 efflux RND transporter periplasmic adaptor subunit [Candidatus Poribacteria bacterium]MYK96431.1 efflux RND transporter periplasmic adaptor subunit [Candidatus Poribacteria bacterium]